MHCCSRPPSGSAAPDAHETNNNSGGQVETKHAEVPFSDSPESGPSTRDASGANVAPGATGAFVSVDVYGTGLNVKNVNVGYQPGVSKLAQNICGAKMEVTYTPKNGQPKTETSATPCSIGASWANFPLNRDMKDGSKVCGRVHVEGQWSNRACVNIHS